MTLPLLSSFLCACRNLTIVLLGPTIQQLAHVAGIVEQLSFELSWQRVPLHNKRSSKTSQNLISAARVVRFVLPANGVFFLEQFIIIGKDCRAPRCPSSSWNSCLLVDPTEVFAKSPYSTAFARYCLDVSSRAFLRADSSEMHSKIACDHNDHDHYADDVKDIHCFTPIEITSVFNVLRCYSTIAKIATQV